MTSNDTIQPGMYYWCAVIGGKPMRILPPRRVEVLGQGGKLMMRQPDGDNVPYHFQAADWELMGHTPEEATANAQALVAAPAGAR